MKSTDVGSNVLGILTLGLVVVLTVLSFLAVSQQNIMNSSPRTSTSKTTYTLISTAISDTTAVSTITITATTSTLTTISESVSYTEVCQGSPFETCAGEPIFFKTSTEVANSNGTYTVTITRTVTSP